MIDELNLDEGATPEEIQNRRELLVQLGWAKPENLAQQGIPGFRKIPRDLQQASQPPVGNTNPASVEPVLGVQPEDTSPSSLKDTLPKPDTYNPGLDKQSALESSIDTAFAPTNEFSPAIGSSTSTPPPTDTPVAQAIPQLETPIDVPAAPELTPPTATPLKPPGPAMLTNGYSAGQQIGDKPPLPYLKEGDYPGKPFSWRTNILDPIARTLTFGAANPHGEENAYNKMITAAAAPGLGAGAANRQNTEAEILQSAKLLQELGYDPAQAHAEAVKFHTNPMQARSDQAGAQSAEANRQGLVSQGGMPGALAEGASAATAATSQNQATAAKSSNMSRFEQILSRLGGPGLKAQDEIATTTANTNQTGRNNTTAQTQFNHDQTLAGGKLANAQALQSLEGAKTKTAGMQEGMDQQKIAMLAEALKNDPAAREEIIKEFLYGKDQVLPPGGATIDSKTHQVIARNPIDLTREPIYNPITHEIIGYRDYKGQASQPSGMPTPQTYMPNQEIGTNQMRFPKPKLGPN